MITEELHNIIISLNEEQKSAFSGWIKRKYPKGNFPKYYFLYQRLDKESLPEEAKLRAGLFKTKNVFFNYRKILLEKLIEGLSNDDNKRSPLEKVQTAFEIGAFEAARHLFQETVALARTSEDHFLSKGCADYRDQIVDDFKFDLWNSDSNIDWNDFQEEIDSTQALIRSYKKAKSSLRLDLEQREMAALEIRAEIDKIKDRNKLGYYYKSKAESIILLLEGKPSQFHVMQDRIGDELGDLKNVLRPVQYAKELSHSVIANLRLENFEKAKKLFFLLSSLTTQNKAEENQKRQLLTSRAIDAAVVGIDESFVKSSFELLQANQNLYLESRYSFKLYMCCLAALKQRNILFARRALHELLKRSKSFSPLLSWQPEIMRLILAFEDGTIWDEWEYLYPSVKRAVYKTDSEYPRFILKCLSKIVNETPSWTNHQFVKAAQEQIASSPNGKRQIKFFDFEIWYLSYITGQKMIQCERNQQTDSDTINGLMDAI